MDLNEILRGEIGLSNPCLQGMVSDAWLNTLELLVHNDGSRQIYSVTYFGVLEVHTFRSEITPIRMEKWSEDEPYQTEEIVDAGESSVLALVDRIGQIARFNDPAQIAGTLQVTAADKGVRISWLATWGCYLEFFHRGKFKVAPRSIDELEQSRRRQLDQLRQ